MLIICHVPDHIFNKAFTLDKIKKSTLFYPRGNIDGRTALLPHTIHNTSSYTQRWTASKSQPLRYIKLWFQLTCQHSYAAHICRPWLSSNYQPVPCTQVHTPLWVAEWETVLKCIHTCHHSFRYSPTPLVSVSALTQWGIGWTVNEEARATGFPCVDTKAVYH